MGLVAKTTAYGPAAWKMRFRWLSADVSGWLTDADLPQIRGNLSALLELVIEAHPHLDDFTPRNRIAELYRGADDAQTRDDFETWLARVQHTTVETYAGRTIPAGVYAAEQFLRLMVGVMIASLGLSDTIAEDLKRHHGQHAQVIVHAALALCPDDPPGPIVRDSFAKVTKVATGRALDLAEPKPKPAPV